MRKSRYTILRPIMVLFILLSSSAVFSQNPAFQELELLFPDACASQDFNTFGFEIGFPGVAFPDGNNFIVRLSDADGDFTNGSNLKTIDGDIDNLNILFNIIDDFSLPTDISPGNGYRIRIESTTVNDDTGELIISDPSDEFSASYLPSVTLILNEGNNVVLCDGNAVEISLNTLDNPNFSDFNYVWFRGSNVSNAEVIEGENGPTLTVTEPDVYFATYDLGDLCNTSNEAASTFVVVTTTSGDQNFLIEGDNTVAICSDETYELTANIDDDDYIYTWFKDGEEVASEEGLSIFETNDTDQFGVYSLMVDIGSECMISAENTIVIEPLEVADFEVFIDNLTTIILLPEEILTFTVSTEPALDDSVATYRWFKDGILIAGVSGNELNVIDEGEYFVEVTDTSSTCTAAVNSDNYSVFNAVAIAVTIRTDLQYDDCNSSIVTLIDVGIEAEGANGELVSLTDEQLNSVEIDYQWFKDDVVIANEVSSELDIESYIDNGEYYLVASISDGLLVSEGSNVIDVLLTPETEIVSSSISNTLCPGDTINLSIETLTGFTYAWVKNSEEFIVDDVSSVDVNEIGEYYVVYEGFGCRIETERVTVVEFDDDALEVSPSTTAVLVPEETTVLTAAGAGSYEWFNEAGDLLSSNETLDVTTTGFYTLVGTVGECKVEKVIEVVPDDGSFTIPNIISPFNGDGVNDTWEIPNKFSLQPSVQVIIYNSRGDELLNTTDYQNNWPEDNNIKVGMLFYFKVIKENNLIKAGTISVLK